MVFTVVGSDVPSRGQECLGLRSNLQFTLKCVDLTKFHPRVEVVGSESVGIDDTESR